VYSINKSKEGQVGLSYTTGFGILSSENVFNLPDQHLKYQKNRPIAEAVW